MDYLYALMHDNIIKKIQVRDPFIVQLKEIFLRAALELKPMNIEEDEFSGDIIARCGENITYVNYVLPDSFANLMNNQADIPDFHIEEDIPKSLFWNDNGRFLFQIFSKRNVLKQKFILKILGENCFSKMEDDAFVVDDKVQVIYDSGKLYFHNYNSANLIFSLKDFVVEATEEEIEIFGNREGLSLDIDQVKKIANVKTRRLITLLSRTDNVEVFVALNKKRRTKLIKDYDVNATFSEDGKFCVPTNNVGILNRTLEFLNEDIFSGPITSRIYRTNSKKKDK